MCLLTLSPGPSIQAGCTCTIMPCTPSACAEVSPSFLAHRLRSNHPVLHVPHPSKPVSTSQLHLSTLPTQRRPAKPRCVIAGITCVFWSGPKWAVCCSCVLRAWRSDKPSDILSSATNWTLGRRYGRSSLNQTCLVSCTICTEARQKPARTFR